MIMVVVAAMVKTMIRMITTMMMRMRMRMMMMMMMMMMNENTHAPPHTHTHTHTWELPLERLDKHLEQVASAFWLSDM